MLSVERLNINANLLQISVNKYDDLLILDCSDLSVFTRFAELSQNVNIIADEADREIKKLNNKYTSQQVEDGDIDAAKEYISTNIIYIKKIMEELNNVFGAGFTDNVFRENYELNPEFVPDELAIMDLIEALTPIMENAYGERIKRNKSKYSAANKGKHTKMKAELIAEYKEKNGIE